MPLLSCSSATKDRDSYQQVDQVSSGQERMFRAWDSSNSPPLTWDPVGMLQEAVGDSFMDAQIVEWTVFCTDSNLLVEQAIVLSTESSSSSIQLHYLYRHPYARHASWRVAVLMGSSRVGYKILQSPISQIDYTTFLEESNWNSNVSSSKIIFYQGHRMQN